MLVEDEIRDLVDDCDKVQIIDLCEACRKNLIAIGDLPAVPQHLIL